MIGYYAIGLICYLAVLAISTPCLALTVSGKITDSAGNALPETLVEIRKTRWLSHSKVIAYVYTNATGDYSTSAVSSGDNVFIRVKWQWGLGANYNWHVVKIQDYNNVSYTDKDSSALTITADTIMNLRGL